MKRIRTKVLSMLGFMFAISLSGLLFLASSVDSYAGNETISSDITASELTDPQGLNMGPDDILTVDNPGHTVTITIDVPLTLKRIKTEYNDTSLIILGTNDNSILTVNPDTYALYAYRDLTIRNCQVNATTTTGDHGCIYSSLGKISIENSTVSATVNNNSPIVYGLCSVNDDIDIINSVIEISAGGYGIKTFEGLNISGIDSRITINTIANNAIWSVGSINIGQGLGITEPQGGIIGPESNGYTIFHSDGTTVATSVTIQRISSGNNHTNTSEFRLPPHVHSYRWEVVQSPTAESDGLEAYICPECGDVKEKSTLPAISVFDEEVIAKIKNAPLGGTVKIETTRWNSLGRSIREALAARPDVTLNVSFLSEGYKGIPLKVTLPAGTDIVGLFDENGYLGLCRAGSTLGYDDN
ncbi:MAG: hypothetical protein K6A38_08735 [Lachnospiraceae bacterium]|nr:hypothetical protein [Lachnospiraceae bacterium]